MGNHTKAAEVEEYITGKWEEEKAGVVEKEMELVPATWKKDKVVEGNVIIGQPDEQAGRYDSRSYTNRACNMVIDSEATSVRWQLTLPHVGVELLCWSFEFARGHQGGDVLERWRGYTVQHLRGDEGRNRRRGHGNWRLLEP